MIYCQFAGRKALAGNSPFEKLPLFGWYGGNFEEYLDLVYNLEMEKQHIARSQNVQFSQLH